MTWPACQPTEDFNEIRFDNSRLAFSNVGGRGGRCDTGTEHQQGVDAAQLCSQGARTSDTPHELYIENVGREPNGGGQMDLVVTNETEYRPWNMLLNGIVRQELGGQSGYFGAVNLSTVAKLRTV